MRRFLPIALLVVATGCSQNEPAAAPKAEPPVVLVASPVEKEVVDYKDYTGRTDAVNFVEVRARVSGYLTKINFEPGREVKKGDVLFVIDKRPYEAALEKAMADIKLADATIKQAEADVARNRPLVKTGVTPQADFDKLVADRDVAIAQREAYRAQADANKLNVDFCSVISPIDGRISRNYITEGNLVAADSTLLTTIASQDPLYVYIDVDSSTVLHIRELIRQGKFRSARRYNDVRVFVGAEDEPGRFPHESTVDFVDNRMDPGTSTLRCRSILPNPIVTNEDHRFSPGEFVRVRLPLGQPHKAILVNERVIVTSQDLKSVYVVNADNEVVAQKVTLGASHDGLRVVEEGLKGDERVIVTNLQRVRPGMKVTPKLQAEYERDTAAKKSPPKGK